MPIDIAGNTPKPRFRTVCLISAHEVGSLNTGSVHPARGVSEPRAELLKCLPSRPRRAPSHEDWAVTELVELSKLAAALRAAAEFLGKFGDSVAHVIQLGDHAITIVHARRTEKRLKDIYISLLSYRTFQMHIIRHLGEYVEVLRGQSPDQEYLLSKLDVSWEVIISGIKAAMRNVEALIYYLEGERSNFILEHAFRDILVSLNERDNLFDHILSIPAPRSTEDLAALEAIHSEWNRLLDELTRATEELARYISTFPTSEPPNSAPAANRSRNSTVQDTLATPRLLHSYVEIIPHHLLASEWYVSYAWGDNREEIVDRLCAAAAAQGHRMLRDKNVRSLGDGISTFMKELAKEIGFL